MASATPDPLDPAEAAASSPPGTSGGERLSRVLHDRGREALAHALHERGRNALARLTRGLAPSDAAATARPAS